MKFLARLTLASLFIVSGFDTLFNFGITNFAKQISNKGFPQSLILAILALALKIIGGISISLDYHTKFFSVALIGFTMIATYLFQDPFKNQREFDTFWRNISIIGGLLTLIFYKTN
jgi:putative oxidoreductase